MLPLAVQPNDSNQLTLFHLVYASVNESSTLFLTHLWWCWLGVSEMTLQFPRNSVNDSTMWHCFTKVAQALIFTSHSLSDCPLLVKCSFMNKSSLMFLLNDCMSEEPHSLKLRYKITAQQQNSTWFSSNKTNLSTFQLEIITSHIQVPVQ